MNNYHPIIIELLAKRGISQQEDVLEFLSEKPKKTYDPFLLQNLEAGVDLLLSAISRGKSICVYGDYDADGITSICLMMQVLSHLTEKVSYYVPCRFDEGYGLNKIAIETIRSQGADVILTVDCGSVSCAEVEYAKGLGMEILITDHHSITDTIADCLVINPKQPGCNYPFKDLAGVGVAFKLAQGLQKKSGLPKTVLTEVLDLVAVGTIGDIVPLVDENRTLVKYGMRELNKLRRKGMRALIDVICQKKGTISSENVTFIIVPHLNAVGRMENASIAVDLLSSQEKVKIAPAVEKLVACNRERKKVQEETFQTCVDIVEKHLSENLFLMICSPNAHEGIAGIVAGKIKDKYRKPTLVITPSGEDCKGTGRSLEKINLYTLLGGFQDIFHKFGGHAGACGFLMKREDLRNLKKGLEEEMARLLAEDPTIFDETRGFDMILPGSAVTAALGETLERLAPFGNQNRKPVFCIESVGIRNPIFMGEEGNHVRFTGACEDGGNISCVFFNRAKEYAHILHSSQKVDLIGTIETQEWNGTTKVQLFVDEFIPKGNN